MVPKIAVTLCFLLLIIALCTEAQRDGRRRTGRRKPTTELPPPEEPESEKNPQKIDAEPESIAKSSSAQPTELETNADKEPSLDKEPANANQSGPPFIVPRGTRKPRPHMRSNGDAKPRPTLPTFSRKRGPKPERRDFKKIEENAEGSSPTSTSTTAKPPRGSSRSRNSNNRNSDVEKAVPSAESPEIKPAAETADDAPKKRFGGGATRRPSRGNRRYNPTTSQES